MTIAIDPLSNVVQIGGLAFKVAALPCGVMRRSVMPLAQRFAEGLAPGNEEFEQILGLCEMSMARAGGRATAAELDETLTITEVSELFQEVCKVSGMSRKGGATGEAQTQPQSNSGEASTGLSQQPQAGHFPI
jgi:hypothetical protein